jgi:DNA-binding LytR/AlgR family response regulator
MKTLIIEDEQIAFEKLKSLLGQLSPEIEIVGHLKSIEEGIAFLTKQPAIDLAFFDIQLEDGLSFSILESVESNFPIIFTTAYDEYAIRAFDHHSIAYLLKPIHKTDLKKALDKHKTQRIDSAYSKLLKLAIQEARKTEYKERFTVKIGDKIRLFETNEICCFFSRDKGTFIQTSVGKQYLVDYSLEQIATLVNPKKYFRANRKHLIRIDALEKVVQHSNSRLKVFLVPPFDEDIIVAREKVSDFKAWLEG